jgi:putative peptidoglycan lipid II flippase
MEKLWALFTRKQATVRSAAFVLMSMVFASRVLGLVRDRLLSARFEPDALGVYFAAFRLPNLLFELLVMGALTSAFIPIFTKFLSQEKKNEAHKMAATLINLGIIVLALVSAPILIWTKEISTFLAPGFSAGQISDMAAFTRFMVVFQVVPLLVGNFFTGILQSNSLFIIPAIAPVVYNLGIIISIILLSSTLGLWAPVVGVAIGALLFLCIQIPLIRRVGYRHEWNVGVDTPGVRDVGRLMGPRTFGLAVSQIDTTVDLMLSSLLGARMVTIFNFAQHLQQLPVGLFGATIAQAALPLLSLQSAHEDKDTFKRTIVRSVHQIMFFVLPASMLFIVLRIPVVRLVFGASRFDWEATVLTGMTLSTFSISLFAQAVIHVLARGFYALYDTKTPVVSGIAGIAVNTALSVLFVGVLKMPIWSLGLSTSVASFVNAGLLFVLLNRRVGGFGAADMIIAPLKMLAATLATGIALYIPLKLLDQLVFDTNRTMGLLLLTGLSGAIGISTYLFLSWVLGVGEVASFLELLKRVRKPKALLLEPAGEVVNGGMQDKIS